MVLGLCCLPMPLFMGRNASKFYLINVYGAKPGPNNMYIGSKGEATWGGVRETIRSEKSWGDTSRGGSRLRKKRLGSNGLILGFHFGPLKFWRSITCYFDFFSYRCAHTLFTSCKK